MYDCTYIYNQANHAFVKKYPESHILGLKFRIKAYHLDDDSSFFIKCSAIHLFPHDKNNHFYREEKNQTNDSILRSAVFAYFYFWLISVCFIFC